MPRTVSPTCCFGFALLTAIVFAGASTSTDELPLGSRYGYGVNKLGCEHELQEWYTKSGFPYTALRLPDVMGPYDNLGCHMRVQSRLVKGQQLPAGHNHPAAYSADFD